VTKTQLRTSPWKTLNKGRWKTTEQRMQCYQLSPRSNAPGDRNKRGRRWKRPTDRNCRSPGEKRCRRKAGNRPARPKGTMTTRIRTRRRETGDHVFSTSRRHAGTQNTTKKVKLTLMGKQGGQPSLHRRGQGSACARQSRSAGSLFCKKTGTNRTKRDHEHDHLSSQRPFFREPFFLKKTGNAARLTRAPHPGEVKTG